MPRPSTFSAMHRRSRAMSRLRARPPLTSAIPAASCSTWLDSPDIISTVRPEVTWYDLGTQPYLPVWRWQQQVRDRRLAALGSGREHESKLANIVGIVEHARGVYTIGRGGKSKYCHFDMHNPPIPWYKIERGGQVTYHGPGQITVYPLLNLTAWRRDLRWYVHHVEEVVICMLRNGWGITAHRAPGLPGVWVGNAKVAQVGMGANRWHTIHGFALNVAPDMAAFQPITPCGIEDRPVTCLAELLQGSDADITMPTVKQAALSAFQQVFDCDMAVGLPADQRDVYHAPATEEVWAAPASITF